MESPAPSCESCVAWVINPVACGRLASTTALKARLIGVWEWLRASVRRARSWLFARPLENANKMTDKYQIRIGDTKQWESFASRNHPFLLEVNQLASLAKSVFYRDPELGPVDRAIYLS